MLKRLDVGVEWVVAEYEEGGLEAPSNVRLEARSGAVEYSTSGDRMQATTVSALRELQERIASGEIVVDRIPVGPPAEATTAATSSPVTLTAPSAT